MEDQVERLAALGQAELAGDDVLTLLEDLRPQLDVARLVDAVHVAERGGEQVDALLAEAERLGGRHVVALGGVELVVDVVRDAVLLAADHADLELEHDLGGGALLDELLGDLQVLVEVDRRAVPHVRLEQRLLTGVHAVLGQRQQRADVAVELVLRAVVGVQRDLHRVLLGHHVGVLGERHGAGDHVLDPGAGGELRTAGGELDDAVAAGVGEAAQRGVDRLRRRAVDRRIGEAALLGPADHVGVDLGSRDRHAASVVEPAIRGSHPPNRLRISPARGG